MFRFRRRQKPLGPPRIWTAVQAVEPVGGIARFFFKETLDLPDMMDLEKFCNRLTHVTETRAYVSYVAVDWKLDQTSSPVPAITAAVLEWLKELDQQPPICDWSLEPEIITIEHSDLFQTLRRIKQEEGISERRWIVGLH